VKYKVKRIKGQTKDWEKYLKKAYYKGLLFKIYNKLFLYFWRY
jgi:hypothetical protein